MVAYIKLLHLRECQWLLHFCMCAVKYLSHPYAAHLSGFAVLFSCRKWPKTKLDERANVNVTDHIQMDLKPDHRHSEIRIPFDVRHMQRCCILWSGRLMVFLFLLQCQNLENIFSRLAVTAVCDQANWSFDFVQPFSPPHHWFLYNWSVTTRINIYCINSIKVSVFRNGMCAINRTQSKLQANWRFIPDSSINMVTADCRTMQNISLYFLLNVEWANDGAACIRVPFYVEQMPEAPAHWSDMIERKPQSKQCYILLLVDFLFIYWCCHSTYRLLFVLYVDINHLCF